MQNLTLIVIPGPGARSLSVDDNMTVEHLISRENLHGRDIIINGSGVPPAHFQTTVIPPNAEVFATGSVKGNSSSATLVVIPGPGARSVSLTPNMTVSQLVCRENLHGRDVIINGAGVQPAQWEQFVIPANSEIFATGSVKGN